MDYILILSILMAVIGIAITASFIAMVGRPGSDTLKKWIIKNGVKKQAVVKEVITNNSGLLTPVVRYAITWGMEEKYMLFFCDNDGFDPSEYPDSLREGQQVNIVYHPNDLDSLYIDMGNGEYLGQCRPQWNILGMAIGFIIMAPVVYFMANNLS